VSGEVPHLGPEVRRHWHWQGRHVGAEETRVAMAETTQFTIGADASCTDGACGEVSRVVVDPVA
jgi:hypothetical protein